MACDPVRSVAGMGSGRDEGGGASGSASASRPGDGIDGSLGGASACPGSGPFSAGGGGATQAPGFAGIAESEEPSGRCGLASSLAPSCPEAAQRDTNAKRAEGVIALGGTDPRASSPPRDAGGHIDGNQLSAAGDDGRPSGIADAGFTEGGSGGTDGRGGGGGGRGGSGASAGRPAGMLGRAGLGEDGGGGGRIEVRTSGTVAGAGAGTTETARAAALFSSLTGGGGAIVPPALRVSGSTPKSTRSRVVRSAVASGRASSPATALRNHSSWCDPRR